MFGVYLENVERFELDVLAVIPEHVHHRFEVFWLADILSHDGEVSPVQQQLPEQLEGLPPSDVVVRVEQLFVL